MVIAGKAFTWQCCFLVFVLQYVYFTEKYSMFFNGVKFSSQLNFLKIPSKTE